MTVTVSLNIHDHTSSSDSNEDPHRLKKDMNSLSYPVNKESNAVTNDNSNAIRNSPRNLSETPQNDRKTSPTSMKKQQRRPWFIWIVSISQIFVFIGELTKNWILTHTPIEPDLSMNPLFGPNLYVLINMGASFPPCMHTIEGITTKLNTTKFPCPNGTIPTTGGCTLSDLCGFDGISVTPNQWYRFIISIFLHVGIVHIILNLFTQFIIAGSIEKKIGVVRMMIIYFASGIFGFILGGNFAADGLCRVGCSGSLFGIIALSLLDLLYNWKETTRPKLQLAILLIDIIVNFVLGLLPGIDNFSHVGGFFMGLLLGLAILGSPINFRRKKVQEFSNTMNEWSNLRWHRKFFHNRPKSWWIWWFVRFVTFAVATVLFGLLTENVYSRRIKCSWCKYISCLPVNGWCDIGKINITNT